MSSARRGEHGRGRIELRRDGHDLALVAAPANTEIGQTLERIHVHDVVAVRSSVPEPVE